MNRTTQGMTARQALERIKAAAHTPEIEHGDVECVSDALVSAAQALDAITADPDGAYRVRVEDDDFGDLGPEFAEDTEGTIVLCVILEHRHGDRPWRIYDAIGSVEIPDDLTVNRANLGDGQLDFGELGETLRKGPDCGLRTVAEVTSSLLPEGYDLWTIPAADMDMVAT